VAPTSAIKRGESKGVIDFSGGRGSSRVSRPRAKRCALAALTAQLRPPPPRGAGLGDGLALQLAGLDGGHELNPASKLTTDWHVRHSSSAVARRVALGEIRQVCRVSSKIQIASRGLANTNHSLLRFA
jgi:hypothetical protein